jgi:demethylsterigmatocystin 6-O-methyltransferase
MRNVLHNWADDKCQLILAQLRDALDSDSLILIDEIVLPNKGASLRATQLDLIMLAGMSSMERTEKQWRELLDSAGYKIANIYVYTESIRYSILACTPKNM